MRNKILNELCGAFRSYPAIEKAVLFGSRARGDNHEKSDFDIAIYGNISISDKANLMYYCTEEIHTLHKIDLVFITETTDEKLIRNIISEGIILYEKTDKSMR